MKLIVGLGNPGKQYERTRHNIGFMVLDALQEHEDSLGKWEMSKKFNSATTGGMINGEKVLIAKPQAFMNNSGQAVQLIAHYYKIIPEHIIVVHDDKDIALGEIKVQSDRGAAGHNGIKSIIEHIGTKNFARIRVGVRSKNERKMRDTAKFVLAKFGLLERKIVQESIRNSIEEIQTFIKN